MYDYMIPSLKDLSSKDIPPLKWVVKGLLSEGLSILAGKAKSGKSWLAMNLALNISMGEPFLGTYPCDNSRVLYLALEDSERRLKYRSSQILESKGIKEMPDEFYYQISFKKQSDGGLDTLNQILESVADLGLVIIDTMAKFSPQGMSGKDSYNEAYDVLGAIHELTKKYQVGILMLHHLRKNGDSDNPFDLILGSSGLVGVVDSMYVLKKQEDFSDLFVTGRDLDDAQLRLKFDRESGIWNFIEEVNDSKLSPTRLKILEILSPNLQLSPLEITQNGKLNHGSTRVILGRMKKEGLLYQPVNGKYAIQ